MQYHLHKINVNDINLLLHTFHLLYTNENSLYDI